MGRTLPYVRWFGGDYLASSRVRMMSLQEQGAYMRLLWHQFEEGAIPADPSLRARILGVSPAEEAAVWPALAPCFEPTADGLQNSRMAEERAWSIGSAEASTRASKARWGGVDPEARSAAGRHAARARWGCDASRNASGDASTNASGMRPGMRPISDLRSQSSELQNSEPKSTEGECEGATPQPAEPAPPRARRSRPKRPNMTRDEAVAFLGGYLDLEPVRDLWARYLDRIAAYGRKLPDPGQAKHRLDGARRVLASHGLAGLRESMERAAVGSADRGPWDSFPAPPAVASNGAILRGPTPGPRPTGSAYQTLVIPD